MKKSKVFVVGVYSVVTAKVVTGNKISIPVYQVFELEKLEVTLKLALNRKQYASVKNLKKKPKNPKISKFKNK